MIRNLRVVPTGPAIVESLDADYVRVSYSFLALWREGVSELLEDVEVRAVTAVLNPAKASLKPKIPDPDKKITLPVVFPKTVQIADVNLLVRSTSEAQDFVLEHLDLDLNPNVPGELRMDKLQIPALPPWTNLSAKTSYANRNLRLTGLVLDGSNQIRLLAIDASRIKARTLELALESSLAGGAFAGSATLAEAGASLDLKARFVADNISLETLRGYLGRPSEVLSGNMDRLEVVWSGAIDTPRSWDGTVTAQLSNLKKGDLAVERAAFNLTARGGVATVQSAELTQGANTLRLTGTATLPANIQEFGRAPASLQVSGALPDLAALTAGLPQPLSGSATLEGRADIADATLRAAFKLSGNAIAWPGGSADEVTALITASKQMPPVGAEKVYYADLQTETNVDVTDVRTGDYAIDSVHAKVRSVEDLVTLEAVNVVRAANVATVEGTYRLPVDLAKTRLQPAEVTVSVNALDIGSFWAVDSPKKVTGPLQIDGGIALRDGVADGKISLYTSNLRSGKLSVPQASAEIAISGNVVYLNDFTASLSEKDYIRANGRFALEKPYLYSGQVAASIADLASLKPILAASGNTSDLAGSLDLNWEGSGAIQTFKNTGNLKVKIDNARYANLQNLEANIDANYTPESLSVPIVYLSSDKMIFQAIMQTRGPTLEVSKIEVVQGEAKYASGYLSLPFVWENLGSDRPLLLSDGEVLVNFQSENLDLRKLAQDFGTEVPVAGLANVKVEAQGTLANLRAGLDLKLTGLRSETLTDFAPAVFNLNAKVENNQLLIAGKFEQARIQPVTLEANLPFVASKIIAARALDDATPVTGKVRMPRSSVNFVRQFVPALQRVDGDLALDVNVRGTIGHPVLSGLADMTINSARFANPTLPALSAFSARLVFNGSTLNFERFRGELAGGPFQVNGRMTFPKLTEPVFELQLKADSVLVARNDNLTARADANVRVSGPLAAASVTGNVALTNSQFLKNIDLIPIGLPGRPPPQPKPPSATPDLSIPQPPFRDWKFDIAIKSKDPFLIRGNLANGGAIVDAKVTGTGLAPKIEGQVRLEQVEATLPFSRLEIQQGFVYFNPDDPLNPKLDLQGISL
ncbi:MAG: translocation/assembly module TamB domain-containing protein, partial [Chthoniobacterales bacterium]|nr:translocation/assembly module TamB domain-containing protein [Chthoniobacterales bacterium]